MNHKSLYFIIALPLIALAIAFYFFIEINQTETDQGWQLEAYLNPLLAAEQFLQRTGTDASTAYSLQELKVLPAGGSIYIDLVGEVLTETQLDRLLPWMEDGGHLILAAGQPESYNRLLAHFSVEVEDSSCHCLHGVVEEAPTERSSTPENKADDAPTGQSRETDSTTSFAEGLRKFNEEVRQIREPQQANQDTETALAELAVASEEQLDPAHLTVLQFDSLADKPIASFSTQTALVHPALAGDESESPQQVQTWAYQPFYWAGSEHGHHLLQFRVGSGIFTVVSDGDIWHNTLIDQNDNAYLLWVLTAGTDVVSLLYGRDSMALWLLVWTHWPELVVASVICLFAWLMYRGRRFGPILEYSTFINTSLSEHLRASGQYSWARGELAQLLQPVRKELEDHARRVLPGYAQLQPDERCRLLSKHCNIDIDEVSLALMPGASDSKQGFTAQVRILAKLRKNL